MGDLFGVISVGPAAMMIMVRLRDGVMTCPSTAAGTLEKTIWLSAWSAHGTAVLAGHAQPGLRAGHGQPGPNVLLWSALRFKPLRASVSNMLMAQTVAAFAGMGWGGFSTPDNLLDSSIWCCSCARSPSCRRCWWPQCTRTA